jgi:hypothetical protein
MSLLTLFSWWTGVANAPMMRVRAKLLRRAACRADHATRPAVVARLTIRQDNPA